MEERYNEVNTIEFECPPLNVMTTQTNVKIVLPDYIINSLLAKRHGNGSFVNLLKDKFDVTFYDYDGTIIDWECSRYTKDASPLTAYEEYEKLFDFNGEKFLEKYPNVKSYYAYVSKRFRESLRKLKLMN